MSVTDPIADMLTRIRNATMMNHNEVEMPASKVKVEIAKLLNEHGYINKFEILDESKIKIQLSYKQNKSSTIEGLKRVSKPGLRVYVKKGEIPRIFGGLGLSIVSTSQGLMTGKDAWKKGVGGELLCYVW
ncbi:MAG TPA: 30S ribosomal protein S8 [Dehalococcoidia bacterium]|jgi:small subunit ribosomal protein S8|nr:30S ribosomal protein S8 [Dehalococcoidia bacterium]